MTDRLWRMAIPSDDGFPFEELYVDSQGGVFVKFRKPIHLMVSVVVDQMFRNPVGGRLGLYLGQSAYFKVRSDERECEIMSRTYERDPRD